MMDNIKVLWVDDQEGSFVDSFTNNAYDKGIDVTWVSSWEEALPLIESRYNEWSALILDCYCKLKKDGLEDDEFLSTAINDIAEINGRMHSVLPWYVLSAGNRDNFQGILKYAVKKQREKWDSSWEGIYYDKTAVDPESGEYQMDIMLDRIKNISEHKLEYKIKEKYQDVFRILNIGIMRDKEIMSKTMIDILMALHYPEARPPFEPIKYYNLLRKMVEMIFRVLHTYGILPDDCIGEHGEVNLTDSSKYLAGLDVTRIGIRYGEAKDKVFPSVIAGIVKNILQVANTQSHTISLSKEDDEKVRSYLFQIKSHYLLFSYALQLCDVIVWLGHYLIEHPDIELNKKMCHHVENHESTYNKADSLQYKIELTDGILHCGPYAIPKIKFSDCIGKYAIVNRSTLNESPTKDKYPYFGKDIKVLE